MSKTFSGKIVIKILIKYFRFILVSQKGSHCKLKRMAGDDIDTTIVPLHKELAMGTLKGILKLGNVEFDEFMKVAKKN